MARLAILILALAFAAAVGAQPSKPPRSQDEVARLLGEVIDVIVAEHVYPADEKTLVQACLRALPDVPASSTTRNDAAAVLARLEESALDRCLTAMVASLDPNSRYMPELDYSPARGFGAIGLHLHQKQEQVFVIGTIEGTPADRAGFTRGDLLVSIDGKDVGREPLAEVVNRLRGKPGSTVTVGIRRSAALQEISLERAIIRTERPSGRAVAPGIGYVWVMEFNEDTVDQVRAALQAARDDTSGPLKGVILDLRWSTGGLLYTAVTLSGAFLADDLTILQMRGRSRDSSRQFRARRDDYGRQLGNDVTKLKNEIPEVVRIPIVVLVSKETISGAELVAAALQDNGRATVIGEPTAAKGDLATIMPLGGRKALRLTTAMMYRPNGEPLHDKGVQPDILMEPAVDRPSDGLPAVPPRAIRRGSPDDPLVAKAIQVLQQR